MMEVALYAVGWPAIFIASHLVGRTVVPWVVDRIVDRGARGGR
jgi:hypothetical protein